MASEQILQQFFDLLAKSPNFINMTAEDQKEIKDGYLEADDETVEEAIKVLNEDNIKANQEIEQAFDQNQQKQKLAKEQALKDKLMELHLKEEKQQTEDLSKTEDLLKELDQL